MTATETMTQNTTTWNDQFAALKTRYPHDPILAAMNLMAQDPNIAIAVESARSCDKNLARSSKWRRRAITSLA